MERTDKKDFGEYSKGDVESIWIPTPVNWRAEEEDNYSIERVPSGEKIEEHRYLLMFRGFWNVFKRKDVIKEEFKPGKDFDPFGPADPDYLEEGEVVRQIFLFEYNFSDKKADHLRLDMEESEWYALEYYHPENPTIKSMEEHFEVEIRKIAEKKGFDTWLHSEIEKAHEYQHPYKYEKGRYKEERESFYPN